MASISNLLSSLDMNSIEFECMMNELMFDVSFDSHEVDTVQKAFVKSVNSRINKAEYGFLYILDKILPRCSKDTFSQYGLFWIANATKVLENVHSSTRDVLLACKVLGVLVEHCKEIPELHKQISMQHVKQLINVLSALQPNAKCGAVYYLIAVLLCYYSEVCEKFQNLIRKMILLQIDSKQENLVKASARCNVLLCKATERSFKPPPSKSVYTATTYNEALLCNNLHAIMDELFSELIELESVDIWDQLELPPISNKDVMQYYNGQKQRFINVCIYLSLMLRGHEARNSVLPPDILGVLCRGLAITPLNLKKDKPSYKEQMLYIILPKLHISLLTVLDAFINGFAQELIPYGTTILQLFQQTLKWTSTISENQMTFSGNKPFRNVRISTYKCLCSWLKNTSSLSGIETIANECVVGILKDITPNRDCILLSMQQNAQHHLSKRAMKRFKQSQYENSTVLTNGESSSKNRNLDADLCKEALIALQNIFLSGSVLLKQTFYKNVQNTVIPLLYNLYLGSGEQNFYKDHNICRLELFRILKALQMNPHVTLGFPVQYCLEISHMAAYDIDLSIIQEAKLALAELEKIIHPAAPTLQLSRQQEPDSILVSENQVEEIATTSRSDKRNRTGEELEESDVTLFVHKRPKVIAQCEIVENGNDIELIEENNSVDINESQVDDKSHKKIEEKKTESASLLSNLHFGSQAQSSISSNQVPENALQVCSCDETQNKKQSQLDIDKFSNVITENKECESDTSLNINTENQNQHKKSEDLSCTDKKDESIEIIEKSSEISEEIRQKSQDSNAWESMDDDVIESLNLFHDEVKLND